MTSECMMHTSLKKATILIKPILIKYRVEVAAE